jgi:hypothetical protein
MPRKDSSGHAKMPYLFSQTRERIPMHFRMTYLAACFTLTSLSSCKNNDTGANSELSAEAAAVASGQEVLLSSNSNPEPQLSPKQTADDLNEKIHFLSGESFPRADIGKYQIAGSNLTGTPRDLQGIWWMDGNPLPDETVSFATVDFTESRPLYPVFGINTFSWHTGESSDDQETKSGNFAYSLAKAFSLAYEWNFNGTPNKYDQAKIVPTFKMKIGPLEKRLRLSPKIMEFTMTRKGPHLYSRDSFSGSRELPSYQLRRILVPSEADPKILEKTEWWALYESQPAPSRLRLTTRK